MHDSFWWCNNINNFLFKGLSTHSNGGLVGVCFCIGLLSFTFEFLRYLQAKQRQKELFLRSQQLKTICPLMNVSSLSEGEEEIPLRQTTIAISKAYRTCLVTWDLSLWFSLLNLGYFLMLSVMVYNGWILVSAVVGGGIGYFIFGHQFMKINLQNCQIIKDTWCMQSRGDTESGVGITDGQSTPIAEIATTSGVPSHCHKVKANVHAECHS